MATPAAWVRWRFCRFSSSELSPLSLFSRRWPMSILAAGPTPRFSPASFSVLLLSDSLNSHRTDLATQYSFRLFCVAAHSFGKSFCDSRGCLFMHVDFSVWGSLASGAPFLAIAAILVHYNCAGLPGGATSDWERKVRGSVRLPLHWERHCNSYRWYTGRLWPTL